MDHFIRFARTVFRVTVPYPVTTENPIGKFLLKSPPDRWDAEISFVSGCRDLGPWPETGVYEDDYVIFRTRGGETLCETKAGAAGPVAYTVCSADLSSMVCYLNTDCYPPLTSLGALMQLIPLKWYLARKEILLFHSAQILYEGRGILFMAPSGTGKTTQSRLWQQYRQAELLCNDRLLMRDLKTYGLPYDGADPVCNPEEHTADAIVFLGQAKENTVGRLRPSKAAALLMQQLLCDVWDPKVRSRLNRQLLTLVESVPVYRLDCTPDEAAVICLENQLRKDGVI